MKTDAVTPQDLRRSVISVPPLARNADYSFNEAHNEALLAHMRDGGVTTYMYGGNANLYHMGISEFGPFLRDARAPRPGRRLDDPVDRGGFRQGDGPGVHRA